MDLALGYSWKMSSCSFDRDDRNSVHAILKIDTGSALDLDEPMSDRLRSWRLATYLGSESISTCLSLYW